MKYILFLLLLVPTLAQAKEYHFVWTLDGGTLEYKTDAKTWAEAYERSAKFCFDFYAKKKPLTEDRGLDIIDVCANPGEK